MEEPEHHVPGEEGAEVKVCSFRATMPQNYYSSFYCSSSEMKVKMKLASVFSTSFGSTLPFAILLVWDFCMAKSSNLLSISP